MGWVTVLGMIDHVAIGCAHLDRSREFYEPLLATLGARPVPYGAPVVGFGADRGPFFWIAQHGETETRELHVAFAAPDRAAVRAFHRAAVDIGAEILHEPRVFPEYHPTYYATFVRDPDGHNIEAVCHTPEQ